MDKVKSIAGIWGLNIGMWTLPQTSKLNEDLATVELVLKILLILMSMIITFLIGRKKLKGDKKDESSRKLSD